MLEFEIMASIDNEIIGQYCLSKRIIKIGRSSSNDICINDSNCNKLHIKIIQTHCNVIIDIPIGKVSTRINNKKTTGILTLKTNDIIEIGTTSLKIIKFTPRKIIYRNNIINKKCTEIFKEDKLLANILRKIRDRLNYFKDTNGNI